MKSTHILLCSLAMLSMEACKKKKETISNNIAPPNVANTVDSSMVNAHNKVDVFTGLFTDNQDIFYHSEKMISFYLEHVREGNPGLAIIKCSIPLQIDNIPDRKYAPLTTLHDTIAYNGVGGYTVGRLTYSLRGTEIGDTFEVSWKYMNEGEPDRDDHWCHFKGPRVK